MTCVIKAEWGVVDSDDGRSSAVGRDILQRGGNAVDAAVAVALVLGVINQGSSGLGGGSFMLVRMNDGRVQGFDMRETAPSLANEAFYIKNPDMKTHGPMSVTVPGEVKGLHEAWRMFGSMKWRELVEPAIRFAEEGFTVSPYLRYQMNFVEQDILKDPGMRDIYVRNGRLVNPGDVCKNPKLAETLKAIAEKGADEFYSGKVGARLVQDIKNAGGIVTDSDLKNYKVKPRVPLAEKIMGFDFLTMPPPASGGAGIILMLNILANYGFPKGIEGFIGLHRFIESCKHMFAVRSHLGDPEFDPICIEVLKDMMSPIFAKKLKEAISDDQTFNDPLHYGGKWHIVCADENSIVKDHGTSHMSIVDRHRNAVALTTSVNYYFGSRFLSPSTGILLNNTMDDFTIPTCSNKIANRIQPNKRPLSSMNPTIILKDGQLKSVVGSSGGFRIPAGTAQVLLNHFGRADDILPSIMQPRIFHQLLPNVLEFEDWTTAKGYHFQLSKQAQDYLKSKGHTLKQIKENNMCQFIQIPLNGNRIVSVDGNKLTAASDPRKGSYPAGY